MKKAKRSSWHSIAWEKHNVFPQGVQSIVDKPLRPRRASLVGASHRRLSLALTPRSRSPPGLSNDTLKEEFKAERRRRIETARVNFVVLRSPTAIIPCTRFQMASWLNGNIDELRMRMHKDEALARRRGPNTRTDKRPGLPIPVARVQPQPENHCVTTAWGKWLQWRTGWYGLEAHSVEGNLLQRFFFVVRHKSET